MRAMLKTSLLFWNGDGVKECLGESIVGENGGKSGLDQGLRERRCGGMAKIPAFTSRRINEGFVRRSAELK
jgi:hypothetical protein